MIFALNASALIWVLVVAIATGSWFAALVVLLAGFWFCMWAHEATKPKHIRQYTVLVTEPMDERELANRLGDVMRRSA